MQPKFVKSDERLIGYIGKTYGTGTLNSLRRGEIVVVEMAKPAKYTKAEFDALTFFETKGLGRRLVVLQCHH